jgi:N utilization substance protein A
MKTEFVTAITQLSAEKNLNADTVFAAVEAAMASAFKKDELQYADIEVKIDRDEGDVRAWRRFEVMDDDEIEDDEIQISPERAKEMGYGDVSIGEFVREEVETTPSTGRIAAQTAKQVVLQRLREAERESVFEDFTGKEGELVSGTVLRVEAGRRQVILDLGRTEAVLPSAEQIRAEHYRVGQRLRVFVKEVYKASKGPQVVVSRANPELIRRLFELEVPEVGRGTVEIMGIARDPGYRSKVAVISRQDGIDPVGATVGVRGSRIQNIVNELGGERIDIIRWDPNPVAYVANALSPAEVVSIRVDETDGTAYIAVPDKQVSLAIGKEGQNAKLAAQLTHTRLNIRAESSVMADGEDLYPPPEPNMDAIPLAAHPGMAATATPAPPDEIAPSQAAYARPGLPGEGAPSAPVRPTPTEEEEPTLTPEQEVLAEFVEEEETVEEVAEPVAETVEVAATPSRSAEPGGLRFGDEIAELVDDEDDDGRDGRGRRGRPRPGRGGRAGRAPQRTPERRPPERQSRRVELDEFDEEEIEAALHGEDFVDEELDEFANEED